MPVVPFNDPERHPREDPEESNFSLEHIHMGSFAVADADYAPDQHEEVIHLHPGPLGFGNANPGHPRKRPRTKKR